MQALLQAAVITIPFLQPGGAPRIDGNLGEWKDRAFHDGVWDVYRVAQAPWFDGGKRNRLTDHGNEPRPEDDLSARYYMAWDNRYLYLGAEVRDNVNDASDPKHEDKRWYFKDAVCWFIEAPRDDKAENFGQGDNAFCYVIDPKRPAYAAWWRHGNGSRTYIEEPLQAGDYAIRMTGNGRNGDFVLEARVDMAATFGASDATWRAAKAGDMYSVEVVHTDPDGGGYGGHLMIWGNGDDDSTWTPMRLGPAIGPVERKKE